MRWISRHGNDLRANNENKLLSIQLVISRVIQYLKEREKEGGGFSFAPNLYPDIEDTYYAIRTFQILGAEVDLGKTACYLKSLDWMAINLPKTIYMIVFLHFSLEIEFPPPLTNLLPGNWEDWVRFPVVDAQYYCDEIQRLIRQPLKPPASISHFQFHRRENLQSLLKKVTILLNHRIFFERQEVIQWVQSCQNGDGGFGFYPGTTSYMENTFCALEILSKLHAFPRRIDECREYILGCQTKSGGFGRAPISFPFIESTFQAIKGLFLLEEMKIGRDT